MAPAPFRSGCPTGPRSKRRAVRPGPRRNVASSENTLDHGTVDRYRHVTARVVLLGGGKSPSPLTTSLFKQLTATIPTTASEIIVGLDHTAPDEKAPDLVAER